jgi:hypothetical protein
MAISEPTVPPNQISLYELLGSRSRVHVVTQRNAGEVFRVRKMGIGALKFRFAEQAFAIVTAPLFSNNSPQPCATPRR